MRDTHDFAGFKRLLKESSSDYWQYYYSFGKPTERQTSAGISATVFMLLVINYVIPLWFAYGLYFEEPAWQKGCFDLLQEIPFEKNQIITKFQTYGWPSGNAFDSQGMIGLYKNYCLPKNVFNAKLPKC